MHQTGCEKLNWKEAETLVGIYYLPNVRTPNGYLPKWSQIELILPWRVPEKVSPPSHNSPALLKRQSARDSSSPCGKWPAPVAVSPLRFLLSVQCSVVQSVQCSVFSCWLSNARHGAGSVFSVRKWYFLSLSLLSTVRPLHFTDSF